MNDYDCPQCQSKNTQSFESVYAQKVRSSYGAGGRYNSWNQLAAQTAPPQNPHVGCGSIAVVFLATIVVAITTATALSIILNTSNNQTTVNTIATIKFFGVCITTGVTFIGGLIFNSRRVQRQIPVYKNQLSEWNRSMLCRRCGHAWLREE